MQKEKDLEKIINDEVERELRISGILDMDVEDSIDDVDLDEVTNIELTNEQFIEIGLNPNTTEPFEKSFIIKEIDHMINVVNSILNEWYIEKDVSDSLREHFIDHYTNQKYTLLYLKTVYLIFNKDKEKEVSKDA